MNKAQSNIEYILERQSSSDTEERLLAAFEMIFVCSAAESLDTKKQLVDKPT